jgi:hypothetical protein
LDLKKSFLLAIGIRVVESILVDTLIPCSMGGAVCADMLQKNLVKDIMGCVVLDVVEGTAIEALSHMNTILVRFHFSFLGLVIFLPSLLLPISITGFKAKIIFVS